MSSEIYYEIKVNEDENEDEGDEKKEYQKVAITHRSAHEVSFKYEDGSTMCYYPGGFGSFAPNGSRRMCGRGGRIEDISNLTDQQVVDKYARRLDKSEK